MATDATPEEVHAVFRNSRIIGRRFRIVHVSFGREVIEVTTFRGHHDSDSTPGKGKASSHSRQSDKGLLLRDNVFGTLEEDAVRRDLTVNALYYDSASFEIYDHVNGMRDIERRNIRIIGDPEVRFREDPVRMLRAVRFAAKLQFDIDQDTADAIPRCARLLGEIPPARLFDEFLKLFFAGYAGRTLEQLLAHDLLRYLFPDSDYEIRQDKVAMALVEAAMNSTDRRIQDGKTVTPAFLLAALLWPVADRLADQLHDRGDPPVAAMHNASQQVIAGAMGTLSIPRRFSMPMREIWEFQHKLERRKGRKAEELVQNRRFRAAYDFLLLRELAGEDTGDVGSWWTEFQELPSTQQLQATVDHTPPERTRRRRPRKRRPSAD
ncbi:polynucleotide adenylyltransferase PcnB [Kineobactrum sediminis]|uniref:polynucleotide adenylyltransferase PcnB n=1 Tax=Kineobactrum sediminis TaxID=1905677 RepID=UPI001F4D88F8|nr:polynucleotide adenylyltransferase PcnB [Kineobactrum sediminis]